MKETNSARQNFTLSNVGIGFNSLAKPYEGKYGANYSIALILDKAVESEANLQVLITLMKSMAKGGPVDVKDESGLNSTGKFKLTFNSKEPIPIFDGAGDRMDHTTLPSLGEGTLLNVKFVLVQGKFGVMKFIEGIQIVKLVPYSSGVRKTQNAPTFTKVSDFKLEAEAVISEADFASVFK